MSHRIRRNPRVKQDILELPRYIARDSFDAGMRFFDAVEQTLAKLAEMPGMGAIRGFDNPKFSDVRSRSVDGFGNHLIFYRKIPGGIEVLRVIHSARDIDAEFEE